MINEKIFGVVKKSMLSDRNLENGTITEQKITEKFIQIIVKEHGDVVTIKRETRENLLTYWNITVMNNPNFKEYIDKYKITFSEFRAIIEKKIEELDLESIDLQDLVSDVLKEISETKLIGNSKR
nr:MAG TPA: hypothetical protein [Caudoviricetes sp.]